MRRVLLGVSLVFVSTLTTGLAAAADLIGPGPVAPVMAPQYDWTGFYVGGNVGGAWGSFDASTTTVFVPTGYFQSTSVPVINGAGAQKLNANGFFTGGVEAGYNWQAGALVVGGEADFGYFGLRGATSTSAVYPCCAPGGFTINSSAHTDWLATVRPRLGLAYDNWLFFATGGLAVTNLNAGFSFSDNIDLVSESASFSGIKTGYVLGGGVEAGLTPNWSVKAEYLYVNFGRISATSSNLVDPFFGPFPQNVFTHSVDLSANLFRLGANYRF